MKDKLILLNETKYLDDLLSELSNDVKLVRFVCFQIYFESFFKPILPKLFNILANGGRVELFVDAEFSTRNFSPKVWLFLNNEKVRSVSKRISNNNSKVFNELISKGAVIKYNSEKKTLLKRILPVWKSDHRKITIIEKSGESIAYWGGINLNESGQNDFMVKTSNSEIVKKVEEISIYFDPNLPRTNIEWKSEDRNITGLFDVGIPSNSLILNTAQKMINNAKTRLIYSVHIPPELPMLLSMMKAEKRGVEIEILLPPNDSVHLISFPYNIAYGFGKLIIRIFKSNIKYTNLKKFSHSKILIVDDEILVGSHNLSAASVFAGVREFSTRIRNSIILEELNLFIKDLKEN